MPYSTCEKTGTEKKRRRNSDKSIFLIYMQQSREISQEYATARFSDCRGLDIKAHPDIFDAVFGQIFGKLLFDLRADVLF